MDSALLQNLIAGAGSSSQLIGGLVVALLYFVIGLLGAIGSIFVFRRMFQGRWEQIFWACFLVVIAAFYLSFAAYFGASTRAWRTELIGVAVFLLCAGCRCVSLGIVGDGGNGRSFGCPVVDREPRVSPGIFYVGWPPAPATQSANAASCAS